MEGEHIAHGFEKSLKERIPDDLELVQSFVKVFRRAEGKLEKGTQVDFVRSKNVLELRINGMHMQSFPSERLASQFLDIYVGEKGHVNLNKSELFTKTLENFFRLKPITEMLSL